MKHSVPMVGGIEHLPPPSSELKENLISKKTNYFCVWYLKEEKSLQLNVKNKAPSDTEKNVFLNGIL